jgi:hypothetical protein
MAKRDASRFDYEVCLSFAGENRRYVQQVANLLRERGIRVFYDEYEKAELWGKDLYVHLDEVYRNAARHCVLFASKHYARKVWSNHERQSAQARALKEHREYVLPVRFDDTEIPGLRDTIGYIDLRDRTPKELADLIAKKVGKHSRSVYFPPVPDRLLGHPVFDEHPMPPDDIHFYGIGLFDALHRMSETERSLVFDLFEHCCPTELPDNVHINIDLLRRVSGLSPARIKRIFDRLGSLGFYASLRDGSHGLSGEPESMLVIEWHVTNVSRGGNATVVASAMLDAAVAGYCEICGREALRKLDFSQLSSATATTDAHPRRSRATRGAAAPRKRPGRPAKPRAAGRAKKG